MRRLLPAMLIVLALVSAGPVFSSTIAATITAADVVGVNRPVPDLAFTDAEGTVRRLSDYKGQVLLIDFWASWCIPCKAAFPHLDSLFKDLRGQGVTVLAVNLDEQRKAANAFLATRPHAMPVVFDPEGKAAVAFNLQGMPSSILVDRRGIVRFVHMGYTEKTLGQYRVELTQLLGEHN